MFGRVLPRRLLVPSTARLLAPALSRTAALAPAHVARRHQSSSTQPTPYRPDDDYMDHGFAKHAQFTFDTFVRMAKISGFLLLALGSLTWAGYEGTHMWVEHVALAAEKDAEVKKWEWDRERERWAGGPGGGTDTGMSFKGAHAVRSAWIAQNWGVGREGNAVMNSKAFSGGAGRTMGGGGLNVVEASLEYAQEFLAIAIKHAESKSERLHPETMSVLLARHANILERMGSRDALYEARSELERVWASASMNSALDERGRLALKIGDLNNRLGDASEAQEWWARAVQLVQRKPITQNTPLIIPESAPSTPMAQRTLVSTLVSLSAFYATTGQLKQAQELQESALDLLRAIPKPTSILSTTPPEALHSLYLLHRSALLSVHLAEVLYALRSPPDTSISWLHNAAESSERVARALTGLPSIHPDAPTSKIPHPPSSDKPLLKVFDDSTSMKRPASGLLRDARRSAAEAWNLIGVLTEGESQEKALECYERALGWVGVSADRVGNVGEAGEGVLKAEWKILWDNYVRAREAVHRGSGKV